MTEFHHLVLRCGASALLLALLLWDHHPSGCGRSVPVEVLPACGRGEIGALPASPAGDKACGV